MIILTLILTALKWKYRERDDGHIVTLSFGGSARPRMQVLFSLTEL